MDKPELEEEQDELNITILKTTKDILPAHKYRGYFILQVGQCYYTFCKSLLLDGHFFDYKDAVKSLNGKL